MLPLFTAAITFGETAHDEHGGEGFRRVDMQVVSRPQLWWNLRNPDEASLWENEITLGEEVYDAVTTAPVPLDIRALRDLKRGRDSPGRLNPVFALSERWAGRAYAAA